MLYMNIVSMYVSHKRLCNYEYIPLNIKRRFAASTSQSDDIEIQKNVYAVRFCFCKCVCMHVVYIGDICIHTYTVYI